ncbi:MAG: OsmC family protein [Acidobacteriota bacterium]|nr:OsmC family protein [Acidobacteriota bacterium]MDH3786119.1 OsmC family protein [Acidobacteriota bacterium]
MSEYVARVSWKRGADEPYIDNKYSRAHQWSFDGGQTVEASSSPHIVPLPYSTEVGVDPEEAFVASLSSCHMLFFMAIAAKQRYVIDRYVDNPVGVVEKDADGKMSMTTVKLRPEVVFSGERQPDRAVLEKLHNSAHKRCFIANSVKTSVTVEIP